MNGNWNKRYVDNSISSSNELKESKYENPSNTATDSFFKAYEVRDIEKQSQTKGKYSNTSNSINELPNKRRCKAEKFESIQYSLGPNEEYIAIRSYEYDIWERNKDNMSKIYQDFSEKGRRMEVRMTKVIKGEFEKIKDVKVEDVPLTCDTSLDVFNNEVSRLSKMDDDLFIYKVEVDNIPCNLKMDNDSEQEADDDMGYDPSNVAFIEWLRSKGDDEVELTNEESFNDEDDIAETNEDYKNDWIYEWNKDVPWVDEKPWTDTRVWTKPTLVKHTCKPFNYKTGCSEWPTCSWKEDGHCNGGNLPRTYIIKNQLHYQNYEWYKALEDSELKDEALRNKAIMEGFIKEDDDESCYEQKRRWNTYTNYNDTYEINHENNERRIM
ncbi:hypothetical protein Tco_0604371 [Tanacetum coccineum]